MKPSVSAASSECSLHSCVNRNLTVPMTLFPATSQVMAVFSPTALVPPGNLAGFLPRSSLLLSVHSPFSSLKPPALNLLSSDCITRIPYLIPMSISSMAISLHFMMNVSLGLLSYSQYYSILNSGQFNTHVHYPSKYAGFLMI